jgi:hypothetical protein
MRMNFFFQGMIIEMVFNNKNQIYIFSNQFIFLKRNKYIYAHYQKKL